ncbi:MAG: hypothetical protein V1837_08575, partial [Candidatus Woesearchaeota archaeon]
MRKTTTIFLFTFLVLLASASAYQVAVNIHGGSLYAEVASGQCTIAQSGNSYTVSGKGQCTIYEWVYDTCKGAHTGYTTTNSLTGYGPWDFYYSLSKAANCQAQVCCITLSQNKVRVGTAVTINANVAGPLAFGGVGPSYAPASLSYYYSVDTSVELAVDGQSQGSANYRIPYSEHQDVSFSYTPQTCGIHHILIKTGVPDCQCSSSLQDSASGTIQAYICQRDGAWGDSNEFQCKADGTYARCDLNGCGYTGVNLCDTRCGASQQCNGIQPGTGNCNLQCKYGPTCGDNTVNTPEQCELPSTSNNAYCSQTTEQCVGNKLAIRNGFGDCNSQCGCNYDPFGPPLCVPGKCNARCVPYFSPSQCDDGNPATVDSCDPDTCLCNHTVTRVCGDGSIQSPEQCERPNTVDNVNCPQSTESCQGPKWLYRDAFGDCNGQCGCVYDSWLAICKLGKCGA